MARLRTLIQRASLIQRAIRPALGTRVGSRQKRLCRVREWITGQETDAPSPICPACRGVRNPDGTRCPVCQGDDT